MSIRELLDNLHNVVRDPRGETRYWGDPAHSFNLLPGIELAGQIVPALYFSHWRILAPPNLPAEIAAPVAAGQAMVDQLQEGRRDPCGLINGQLLVIRPEAERGMGMVVFLDMSSLARCLAADFPDVRLTPALLQLLAAVLAGIPIKTGHQDDLRSAETRKTQARALRDRFGLATTEEVGRIVGAFILRRVEAAASQRQRADSQAFHAHIDRFYPEGVQSLVLLGRDGEPCRVLAMGPVAGRPVIMLHPLILPSIADEDIEELHRLNLRLYWPLRIGQLAPHDRPASEEETIRHALRGIDLVRSCFCGPTATLVSIAAASKIALAYARRHPERVNMICTAAACVLRGRPQTANRRLAKSILDILDRTPWLAEGALRIATSHLLSERRFRRFLTDQFAENPADGAIIRYELDEVAGGHRIKEAIELSLHSIRNDFAFQLDLEWDQARHLKMPLHILHGAQDSIHPLPMIRALAAGLPDAKLHVMPETGQLLMGPSLRRMFRLLAGLVPRT